MNSQKTSHAKKIPETGYGTARFVDSIRDRRLSHGEIIRAAIVAKKNLLIVGSTGSGKTTLVNAFLDTLARMAPRDRVVSIEDTTELQCAVRNYVDLRAVGSITMLDCLRASMRLKPTRIVIREVRGAEAHTMLKAWNTGHPGGAGTVHANDAVSGLVRLESLVAEATSAPQQSLIAEAVDLVVFIDEEPDSPAGRKVREVLVVTGYGTTGTQSSMCNSLSKGGHVKPMKNRLERNRTAMVLLLLVLTTQGAWAGGGGGGLPWETPLNGVATSLTGPVALSISLIALMVAGGPLVFGGELSEFARRSCVAVMAIAFLVLGAGFMTALFGVGGATVL